MSEVSALPNSSFRAAFSFLHREGHCLPGARGNIKPAWELGRSYPGSTAAILYPKVHSISKSAGSALLRCCRAAGHIVQGAPTDLGVFLQAGLGAVSFSGMD